MILIQSGNGFPCNFQNMTNKGIIELIRADEWMMEVLRTVRDLGLPDWWVGAGFVRSKVWDHLHGYAVRTPLPDIDVIYFDPEDFSPNEVTNDSTQKENNYEKELTHRMKYIHWSVTNQARMHVFHNDKPYHTSEEALSRWVETATCIGARLLENDTLVLTAPHGIEDLVSLKLRPTFTTPEGITTFYTRVRLKDWQKKWPKLTIVT